MTIIQDAASSYHKLYRKWVKATKCIHLYEFLLKKFQSARTEDHILNFSWLWSKARKSIVRYKLIERLNVDQSLLPFVVHGKCAYEYVPPKEGSTHNTWISQPGLGLEKRQCTL